ncbi:MAG: hypothetical protein GTO14_00230 [Anaerolineales bacterium]|nr:hypothetical protein [Anaerolineales bacterium]
MPCACLFALLAAGTPRLALVLLWIFTTRVGEAFEGSILIPILGFFLLPLTTVFYVLVSVGGLSPFDWFLLAVGFLIDIGSYGSGVFGRRRRE